jgi:phosphate transport system substrate-binding protein
MRIKTTLATFAAALILAPAAFGQSLEDLRVTGETLADITSRERLVITGSTTMDILTNHIAKRVAAKNPRAEAPLIQSEGSSTGIKAFCAGIGVEFPDIVASSRRMRKREFDSCIDRLILDIIELKIGYSALAIVTKKGNPTFDILPRMMYLGLAAQVPVEDELAPNNHKTWFDVLPTAPKTPIRVYGPDLAAGSRGIWDDSMMQGGCRHIPQVRSIFSAKKRVAVCTTKRKGDFYIGLPEPFYENALKKIMEDDQPSLAIVPYHYYAAHADKLDLLPVEGVEPSTESISEDRYHLASPLYYYVKRAHMRDSHGVGVVRGLREFIAELMDEHNIGPGGSLVELGLTPLPEWLREEEREEATFLKRFEK